jgi:molecular chaperone HtpG
VAKIALFESSAGEELTTLDEYVARMPEGQEHVLCLAGASRRALESSPHLEAVRERGFEVLYLVDPVDEWVLERLTEYDGKSLKALDRGEAGLETEERKQVLEQQEREQRDLLEALEGELKADVQKVRFSSRLKDSPAVLVDDESAMGPYMERLMRQTGHEPPPRKRILELNPDHPVLARMKALHDADPASARLKDFAHLLLGQALLAEGSPLKDPVRFGKLVSDLMVAAGD